ncbi:MAG: cytidine deaminase [Clostridiaceae bacterium]|jgi:cytidine deaminase|nr:cytidine deaminase [Clostridiaceae bacterium]
MDKTATEKLIENALKARENAYDKYGGFAVGAALLCADGRIFWGSNVENASYGLTVCAERVAVFNAVSAGAGDFTALALAGGDAGKPPAAVITPCGACRQVLAEFCGEDFTVICAKSTNEYKCFTLAELLPNAFRLKG